MRQDVVYRVSLELRISLHPEEFISNIVRAWRMPASPPDRAAGASAPRTSTASLSLDAWLDREIPALVEDLTGTLNALWLERFCTGVSSAEQAARCVHGPLAHGRGAAPAFEPRVQAALETLRSALTEDPAPLYACGGAQ
jgi:hypothetical protein